MRLTEFTSREDLAGQGERAAGRLAELRWERAAAELRVFGVTESKRFEVDYITAEDEQRPPIPERWLERGLDITDVYGVGISAEGEDENVAVLAEATAVGVVSRGREEGRPGELSFGRLADELEVPRTARLIGVSAPEPLFAPGAKIDARPAIGTLGAMVTTGQSQDGILTAGHVAVRGGTVHDSHGQSGVVAFSIDPGQVPAMVATADVAVIVPGVGAQALNPTVTLSSTAKAQGGAKVTMHGAVSGTRHGRIMGFTPFLFVPKMAGQWTSVYFTTAAISVAGDSGAPVVLDGTGELIGHVVGGSGAATTYIQSIDEQLAASGSTFQSGP